MGWGVGGHWATLPLLYMCTDKPGAGQIIFLWLTILQHNSHTNFNVIDVYLPGHSDGNLKGFKVISRDNGNTFDLFHLHI